METITLTKEVIKSKELRNKLVELGQLEFQRQCGLWLLEDYIYKTLIPREFPPKNEGVLKYERLKIDSNSEDFKEISGHFMQQNPNVNAYYNQCFSIYYHNFYEAEKLLEFAGIMNTAEDYEKLKQLSKKFSAKAIQQGAMLGFKANLSEIGDIINSYNAPRIA